MKKSYLSLAVGAVLVLTAAIASPAQTLTTLVNFNGSNGKDPVAPLILARDGNFYGTTENGGALNRGSVFQLTPSGTLTTLYSFTNGSDG